MMWEYLIPWSPHSCHIASVVSGVQAHLCGMGHMLSTRHCAFPVSVCTHTASIHKLEGMQRQRDNSIDHVQHSTNVQTQLHTKFIIIQCSAACLYNMFIVYVYIHGLCVCVIKDVYYLMHQTVVCVYRIICKIRFVSQRKKNSLLYFLTSIPCDLCSQIIPGPHNPHIGPDSESLCYLQYASSIV